QPWPGRADQARAKGRQSDEHGLRRRRSAGRHARWNRAAMSRGRRSPEAVLLVEGNDDKHVFWALLAAHEPRIPTGSFDIEDCGGDERLLENLRVRLKANNNTRIGVVLDADTDLAARWASLRTIVNRTWADSIPKTPPAEGLVVQLGDGPRLGV